MIEKMESRIADKSTRDERRPINPRDSLDARVQKPSDPPPISGDWTAEMPRLDPQYARIEPPAHGDRTPDVQGHRTRHPG